MYFLRQTSEMFEIVAIREQWKRLKKDLRIFIVKRANLNFGNSVVRNRRKWLQAMEQQEQLSIQSLLLQQLTSGVCDTSLTGNRELTGVYLCPHKYETKVWRQLSVGNDRRLLCKTLKNSSRFFLQFSQVFVAIWSKVECAVFVSSSLQRYQLVLSVFLNCWFY